MHWRRWRCGPARHPDIVKVVDGQALPDAQAGHVGVALTCWQHLHRDVEELPFGRLELDVAKAKRGVVGQIAYDQLGRRAILLAFDSCPEADRVPKDAARHVERSERDLRDALVPEGARHLDEHAEGPLARGGGVLRNHMCRATTGEMVRHVAGAHVLEIDVEQSHRFHDGGRWRRRRHWQALDERKVVEDELALVVAQCNGEREPVPDCCSGEADGELVSVPTGRHLEVPRPHDLEAVLRVSQDQWWIELF